MGGVLDGVAAAAGDVFRWGVGQVLAVILAVAGVAIYYRLAAADRDHPGSADDHGDPADVAPRLGIPVVGHGVDGGQHDKRDKTRHP